MDDRQRLHRFQEAPPPTYVPAPGAFQPFSPVVPSSQSQAAAPPVPSPSSFRASQPAPSTPPLYDSALRPPWAQSTSASSSAARGIPPTDPPPLRGVPPPQQPRLGEPMQDVGGAIQAVAGLSLEEGEEGDREGVDMRGSQGSHGSQHGNQPPRRMQRGQTMPLQYGGPVAGPSGDTYGRGVGSTSPIFGMPAMYQQQPSMQQYPQQRAFSPPYPSAMQMMMGGPQIPYSQSFPYPGMVAHDHSPTQHMLGTSPVGFGANQQPSIGQPNYAFQRTSPDSGSAPFQHQQGRNVQQQRYPNFPYSPSNTSPLPQGPRGGPHPSQYPGMTYSTASSPPTLAYSPQPFQLASSPVFSGPRYGQGNYGQQYTGPPSPEESMRAGGGGTWYYVPDTGQGFEQPQNTYTQTFGLGFMPSAVQRSEGEPYTSIPAQAPISPLLFPTGPSHVPPYTSPPPPLQTLPLSEQETEGVQSAPPEQAAFRDQVSQIPFPSISPTLQNRAPRRPLTPTRRPYHPNPPANRSEWVMWVGNVPHDATHDELWRYFNQPVLPARGGIVGGPSSLQLPHQRQLSLGLNPEDDSGGVSSVFLISRSNCAFVNFNSESHLERAVAYFNGKPIRPNDPRCPRLVCRVRRRDDDLRAGVGGQRGVGIHTRWVKEQREKEAQQAAMEAAHSKPPPPPPQQQQEGGLRPDDQGEGEERHTLPQGKTLGHSGSSGSFASTNSSFLAKNFPKRYFILKSLTQFDLNLSVERGLWATQAHNEPILDQAFRTSQDVYLIFGANKSGEFYGYARMAGPVPNKTDNRVSWASRTESSHSSSKSIESPIVKRAAQGPAAIAEDSEGEHRSLEEEKEDSGEKRSSDELQPPNQGGPPAADDPIRVQSPGDEDDQERRDDNLSPAPEHVPSRSLLNTPAHAQVAASPAPMTPDEEKSIDSLVVRERPVHRPHMRTARRSKERERPSDESVETATPEVPTGDDVPKPPKPQDVMSAPAEVGPERRKFTFDEPENFRTLDSTHLRSTQLAAVLAAQPADFELSLPETAAERQAKRGSSQREAAEDEDGVKRKDTAPSKEEIRKHDESPDSPQDDDHAAAHVSPPKRDSPPKDRPQQPKVEPATGEPPAGPADSPEEGPPQFMGMGGDGEQWGTPFKVDWIKVEPLPFHRTRHLRNPWNNDREVKVSRDGTEVEPSVGARLLAEWDRTDVESAASTSPITQTLSRRQGSRPPFRPGYSAPALPHPPVPLSPYMAAREGGGLPQWLFEGGPPPSWH